MARMRILITGITGFVGSHLTEWALSRGADVIGALRWRSNTEHIEHLRDRLTLIQSELREQSSARDLVERARPDYIVHLAAQSFVGASWQTPAETLMTNAIGQMNPLRPLSPYAVSKVTQDLMGFQYFKSYGLDIVRARAFHQTGPRRSDNFSTSTFARQIVEIEAGLREPVVIAGDLKPVRDFSDVRDIVRGYWDLLEHGTAGEVYNLCSGVDWTIERMLTFLISQSSVPGIEIRTDAARLRPSDVPVLRGSYEKIERAVGWRPRIPLEQTLTDLLDYWRQRIR